MHKDIVLHVLTQYLILVTLLCCTLLFISFDVLIMTQGVEGCTGESCIFLIKDPKSIFREGAIAFFFPDAFNSVTTNLCLGKILYLGEPLSS